MGGKKSKKQKKSSLARELQQRVGVPAELVQSFVYGEGAFPRAEMNAYIECRMKCLSALMGGKEMPGILATYDRDKASEARVVLTFRAVDAALQQIGGEL